MSDLKIHQSKPAAWIKVEGDDSLDFLQSQFSNDLKPSIDENSVTYGLWLDRKGKVHADSFVINNDKVFYLFSYNSKAEVIIGKLSQFIIADDVTLIDETENVKLLTWYGDNSDSIFKSLGATKPEENKWVNLSSGFSFNGRRNNKNNYDLIINNNDLSKILIEIEKKFPEIKNNWIDQNEIERDRIDALIPSIPNDIGKSELPQEGNLENSAISFNKGCYLGQEVMARLHSMGNANRILTKVSICDNIDTKALPCPIYHVDKKIGMLKTVAKSDKNNIGLALISKKIKAEVSEFSTTPNGHKNITIFY